MNPPPGVQRIEIMGCGVDNLTMDETLDVIEGFVRSGTPHQHVVVNVDKVVKARDDAELRDIINDCALINADGMPVVWASRLLGTPLKERVAGVDLFEAIMARAAAVGWRVFLLGAREEVVSKVKAIYEAKYPGLADILFVAISSPKKERFLGKWQSHMKVPFAMGVGGTFDVAAGLVKRAPLWMQKTGFEWFYRFLQEPRRMYRRYFIDDMAFFGMLGRELWSRRRAAMKRGMAWFASVAAAAAASIGLVE
jgi:N-acetylglucosaminyldiphosphoundecaprenol N-acetyl-beta-D-mannosaminyltransferase